MDIATNDVKPSTERAAEEFERFYALYDKASLFLNSCLNKHQKEYIDQRRAWIKRLRQAEFPVAFFGSFSSGKSTTINALLGAELLPEGTKATTAVPTIIRASSADRIEIHFISDQARLDVRGTLAAAVSDQLGEAVGFSDDEIASLAEIEKKLEKKRAVVKELDPAPYSRLKRFIERSADFLNRRVERIEGVDSATLHTHVEGNEDSIFIQRIEVFISNIRIPPDVVLVDLPGLGVLNKQHEHITKAYIESDAKAFVVCLKPFHLLEGEEMRFLLKLYNENKSILSRAFWVLNQWDILTETQKKGHEADLINKVGDNFSIKQERIFKVSALNYLAARLLERGTLSDRFQGHMRSVSNYEMEKARLEKNEDVTQFSAFREALFRYLNGTAKAEFISSARSELHHMLRDVETAFSLLRQRYPEDIASAEKALAIRTVAEVTSYREELERLLEQFGHKIRNVEPLRVWTEEDKKEALRQLQSMLDLDTDELTNEISRGADNPGDISRLPAKISERLRVGVMVRDRMMDAVTPGFLQMLDQLLYDLQTVNEKYMPLKLRESLADKLSGRDLRMRLNGLADCLMAQYYREIAEAGAQVLSSDREVNRQYMKHALEIYSKRLSDFLLEMEVSKYLGVCTKNHAEQLIEEISSLLRGSTSQLSDTIAEALEHSDILRAEKDKREHIRSCESEFEEIRSSFFNAAPS